MEIEDKPKTRYHKDAEYRKRHLEHMTEKIKCECCDVLVARCNMPKHRRTGKHKTISKIREASDISKTVEMTNDEIFAQIQILIKQLK